MISSFVSLDFIRIFFLKVFCKNKINVQKKVNSNINLGKNASPGYPGNIDLDIFEVS